MKIIITGVTGFLGSKLAHDLYAEGHQIIGLSRKKIIDKHLPFEIKYLEKWEEEDLASFFSSIGNIDSVIHLGASLNLNGNLREMIEQNCIVTKNLANASKIVGIQKFIYASSIEAASFGFESSLMNILFGSKVLTSYGKSKSFAENEIKKILSGTQIKYYILRIGNVFAADRLTFVSDFLQSALNQSRFGYQRSIIKNYTFMPILVDDVSSYICKIISRRDGDALSNMTLNVCSSKLSAEQIFQCAEEEVGMKIIQTKNLFLKIKVYMVTMLLHSFYKLAHKAGDNATYFLSAGIFIRRNRSLQPDDFFKIGLSEYETLIKLRRAMKDNIKLII